MPKLNEKCLSQYSLTFNNLVRSNKKSPAKAGLLILAAGAALAANSGPKALLQ